MDYIEQLDKLIEQFAGETSGMLSRVRDVCHGVGGIEKDIDSITKAFTAYKQSVESSSKKLSAAGAVFVELKQAADKLSADIQSISTEQQHQTETLKTLRSLEGISKYIVQISHAVNEGNTKAANDYSETKERETAIADEQRLITAKIDKIGKSVEKVSGQHSVIEGQMALQNAAIGDALQAIRGLSEKNAELQASIKDLQKLLGGISEKCDGLQTAYSLLSGRIDSFADEMKALRAVAEEKDKHTHELLERVLSKMEDMESALTTKKRGFFK